MLNQSDIYTDGIVDACIDLWSGPLVGNSFGLIICGRIVDMVQNSQTNQVNWFEM